MELCSVPETLEYTALKWGTSSRREETSLMWEVQRAQSFSYHHRADRLQGLLSSLSVSRPSLEYTQSQLQLDMAALEEEFRQLLLAHSSPVDLDWIYKQAIGPRHGGGNDAFLDFNVEGDGHYEDDVDVALAQAVSGFDFVIDLIPLDVVFELNAIARRMIAGGCARECCQVYSSIRKAALDHNLSRLGMEKVSMDNVQKMMWGSLETKIMKWNIALKIAVQVLYGSEKMLCNRVFDGLNQWVGTSFLDVSKDSIMQLMGFAEAIAISRRSPEKLFKILDMYETLSDGLPSINAVFSDGLCLCICKEAKRTLLRLGEAARGIFAEFENAIQREASKISVPGGAVHPLTRYVTNYICFLFCYMGPLKQLLGSKKKALPEPLGPNDPVSTNHLLEVDGSNCADHLSPLGVQIVWLLVLLECNLDGKSKLYKEIALSYLFLMNNMHYVVQKVKKCEFASLVGEEWVKNQSIQVRQYATNYIRASWKKMLTFLQDEGPHASSTFLSGVSKSVVKDKLKCFNTSFEDLHRTQSAWSVPDPELREELRISIEEKVIPTYRSFLARYQCVLTSSRERERYIKYEPEDLEKCLLDLFEGTLFAGGGTQRMSFSTY